MKRILQTGNAVAYFAMLIVSYLSNTGLINNNTMATVSEKYENLFTPAGYAFSIWGLIYLLLLGFVIYQGRGLFKKDVKDDFVLKIGWWFIISCVANSLWVFAFLYEELALSVFLMALLLFSLLRIVVNLNMERWDPPLKIIAFLWWPFAVYSGWVAVAAIANVAVYLTKTGWEGFGLSEVFWTVAMIIVAGIVNLYMILTRNMREFALPGIWALIAIAMANRGEHPDIVTSALFVSAVLLATCGIQAYKNRKTLPFIRKFYE